MEKEIKKEDVSKVGGSKETPKMRQIIIETDGTNVNLVKAEVGGAIELVGILQKLIEFFNKQK